MQWRCVGIGGGGGGGKWVSSKQVKEFISQTPVGVHETSMKEHWQISQRRVRHDMTNSVTVTGKLLRDKY